MASKPPGPAPATAADRAQIQAEYQAAYALLSPQQRRYEEAAAAFETACPWADKRPLTG